MTDEKVNELKGTCDLKEFVELEKELVVLGYMGFDESDDVSNEFHDCDAMGCSSYGPHVLFRFKWSDGIAK